MTSENGASRPEPSGFAISSYPRPEMELKAYTYGEVPPGIAPMNTPSGMKFLGAFSWAWSPMHNRADGYFLHRARRHWLIYVKDQDPNYWPEYLWVVGASMLKAEVSEREAAIWLMIAYLEDQRDERDLDEFHFMTALGDMDIEDWNLVAKAVWAPNS